MLAIDVAAVVGNLELRVTLPAHQGTTIVIGPNGAGKSTLLKSLLGAIKLSMGEITLDGHALYSADRRIEVPTEERRIGYVPQRYALFPHMTVSQNVGYGIRGVSRMERARRVRELLDDLGIAHLSGRRAPQLSGGESQRVALARAMAIAPRALLLDEPMAALDADARRRVRKFLSARLRAVGIPTVVVSHDVEDVEALGGRVAVLENGRIVQTGSLEELRAAPATPFVQQFLCAEVEKPTSVAEIKAWG